MGRILSLVVVLLAACGSDEPPPSCQQAITQYYSVGCAFFNASTNMQTSQSEALEACIEINSAVPEACRGELEVWLECVHGARSDADCDCTQESDALFVCG